MEVDFRNDKIQNKKFWGTNHYKHSEQNKFMHWIRKKKNWNNGEQRTFNNSSFKNHSSFRNHSSLNDLNSTNYSSFFRKKQNHLLGDSNSNILVDSKLPSNSKETNLIRTPTKNNNTTLAHFIFKTIRMENMQRGNRNV